MKHINSTDKINSLNVDTMSSYAARQKKKTYQTLASPTLVYSTDNFFWIFIYPTSPSNNLKRETYTTSYSKTVVKLYSRFDYSAINSSFCY